MERRPAPRKLPLKHPCCHRPLGELPVGTRGINRIATHHVREGSALDRVCRPATTPTPFSNNSGGDADTKHETRNHVVEALCPGALTWP